MSNESDAENLPESPERLVRQNVVRLREERGWSQSELARRMVDKGFPKYNQMMVSRTEKGERPLRLDEVAAYASVFGVGVSELWRPSGRALVSRVVADLIGIASNLEALTGRYLDTQERLVRVGQSCEEEPSEEEDESLTQAGNIESMPAWVATTPAQIVEDATREHLFPDAKEPLIQGEEGSRILSPSDSRHAENRRYADEYLRSTGDPQGLTNLRRRVHGLDQDA